MSRLSASDRRAMPASEFAGPGRSFPIPDKGHARAALSDLPRAEAKGSVSPGQAASIRAKAHAKLADHHLALHVHHHAIAAHHEQAGQQEVAELHRGVAEHHMGAAQAHHEISEASGFPSRKAGDEGSAADERQDRAGARKAGVSEAAYEGSPADQRADAQQNSEQNQRKGHAAANAGADHLAAGAAHQLHRKGHIDAKTRDKIVAAAGGGAKRRPFGSLSGAGHYMGDVDSVDSAGTM